MVATRKLAQDVGARAACDALGVPRASDYRDQSRLAPARRPGRHRDGRGRRLPRAHRRLGIEQLLPELVEFSLTPYVPAANFPSGLF